MELKIPFKLRVKFLNLNDDHFEGKATFHENEYKVNIHAEVDKKKIKVPFPVMGVTDEEILVRISGPIKASDGVKSSNGSSFGITILLNNLSPFSASNL